MLAAVGHVKLIIIITEISDSLIIIIRTMSEADYTITRQDGTNITMYPVVDRIRDDENFSY